MRWLQNISFSSSNPSTSGTSSSSSSSSSSASLKHTLSSSASASSSSSSSSSSDAGFRRHSNHRSYLRGGALAFRFGGGSRLARQRKLCYLSEQDVSTTQRNSCSITVKSSFDSSEPVQLTRSPSSSSVLPSRLSTSVPLPLPLPLPAQCGDGDSRFPSPKDKQKEKEKAKIDGGGTGAGAGEGVCSSTRPIRSVFVGKERKKMVEHLDIKSPRVHPDFCLDNCVENFGINIPCRSAPTSPFSSPVVSPQRLTSSDWLRYYQMIAKGNQVWSAPEMATGDMTGLPPPAFFDFTALSTDSSPLHSPPSRSPSNLNPRSPNGPPSSSPLNAKLSIEATPPIANIEVHPLPLPPGAAKPSSSAPIPQVISKAESMPLKSQWQKGKLIGRGTFGSVYVASNRETGALCAMKEVDIFPDDPKSAESIKQLEQEIKVLSQLKHPNIVQYYGSEIVEDHFYIYLEYVHPGSINKYVHEHCGAITENVVRSFTRHILSGLAYLHSMKTIHRDIKGANLLVDASGVVKLADFGMSKLLTGQAAELSLRGSPYWMAPELMQAVMQKDSNSDLALAVDIWSLGCTIIEMLTGKPPWSDFEGAAAMFKVLKDTPPIPETLSPEGKDFLCCCFKRNPAERSSASMLLEHRWLKNSQQLEASSPSHSINGIRLMDISYCPNTPEVKFDQTSIIPGSQRAKGKVPSDCFMRYSFSSARMPNDTLMKLPT